MPLISLWQSNPQTIEKLKIEQVVVLAGDGALKDHSLCSKELRDYFSLISSEKLIEYAEQCFTAKFERSGMVLQDVVNALGKRLEYDVMDGLYQGIANSTNHDGIWRLPADKKSVIIEVKTTDTYRIDLEKLVGYRQKLLDSGELDGKPSILIVVGRDDTGGLETQVRGSRHAWDIRIISVEALCKLVKLKENSDPETGKKIREILMPLEYTRLDQLVDIIFTTVSEVAADSDLNSADEDQAPKYSPSTTENAHTYEFTDARLIQEKRDEILKIMSNRIEAPLLKKSRALYWNVDRCKRIACTMSKLYGKSINPRYWYAFHPQWDEFLSAGKEAYLVLGCMDLDYAFPIPHDGIRSLLPYLNTTISERGTFWHIHLIKIDESYEIINPKSIESMRISEYIFQLPSIHAS